jgi:parvulin-like peptidyl-prolyl isomerase
LLVRFPENPTLAQKDSVKQKVEEAYGLITSGKLPFDEAVKTYSDDKATRVKGGELQWFGSGTSIRMVPEFEDAALVCRKMEILLNR